MEVEEEVKQIAICHLLIIFMLRGSGELPYTDPCFPDLI